MILTALVAGCGLAYFGLFRGASPSGAPSAARVVPGIPVMASKVQRTDVPIVLTGLGTVQAFNSVLVKSRVDGQIVKINFSEGKDVHAGDVLVEIEPDYLSGQNIRPRIELNELNLAADVVQNFVEHFIHKIELPPIEPEGNREF